MYAFVHIKKTGGTTIINLLRRNFGLRHFDTGLLLSDEPMNAAQLRRVKIIYPGLKSIAGHNVRAFSDLGRESGEIKYYTFLREPIRRVISDYCFGAAHQIRRLGWRPETKQDLEDYLRRIIERSQNGMCLALSPDAKSEPAVEALDRDIGFVGLVEKFDESLRGLKQWMDGDDLDIRYSRANVSEKKTVEQPRLKPFDVYYRKVLDYAEEMRKEPRLLGMIADANRQDLALFEHALKKRYPAQKAKYDDAGKASSLEQAGLPADSAIARAYRNVVARPMIPLLTRGR